MVGELYGTPEQILAAARAIFNAISPMGRVRLSADGAEIVFETPWAKGIMVDRFVMRDGFPKELVRHAGVLSLKASVYKTVGSA